MKKYEVAKEQVEKSGLSAKLSVGFGFGPISLGPESVASLINGAIGHGIVSPVSYMVRHVDGSVYESDGNAPHLFANREFAERWKNSNCPTSRIEPWRGE